MFTLATFTSIIILGVVFHIIFKKNNIVFSNKPFVLSVKLIILLVGVIVTYINLIEFDHYHDKKFWNKVKGEVVSFEIVGIKTREPEIDYSFNVNDSVYTGRTNLHTPLFGSRKYQEQTARTISGNYQVGDSVMVYYNPENPKESALKIAPVWSTYMQLTFGVFIISIILALMIPQKPKKENNN